MVDTSKAQQAALEVIQKHMHVNGPYTETQSKIPLFLFASAKLHKNVDEAFQAICKQMLEWKTKKLAPNATTTTTITTKKKRGSWFSSVSSPDTAKEDMLAMQNAEI